MHLFDSGKRRRSWRTQKYLLSHPIFSQEIIADIHKSFGEADYFTKMGNIWRSFWYTGLIILLSAFNMNGNDALAGITMKKRIRRKGRTPLIPFQGQSMERALSTDTWDLLHQDLFPERLLLPPFHLKEV